MSMRHVVLAAPLLSASCAAFAASSQYASQDVTAAASKTRAQVREELLQAESQGLTNQSDDRYPIIPQPRDYKTRSQVLAELREAQSEGLINSRDDLYPVIPNNASHRTRSEVRGEAIRAAHGARDRLEMQGPYFGG